MATRPMTEADLLRPALEGIGGPNEAMPETGIEFEFPDEGGQMVDGALLSENDDGSVEVDFEPSEEAEVEESEHDENLCEYLSDMELSGLAEQLMSGVADDLESRGEWETTMKRGIELLGLTFEDRTTPFNGACGVFDPLMAEAVIRWQATARGELMPAAGPVKTQIIGVPNADLEAQASRVQDWMNLYLTELAPEYYEEFDQMLMWLSLVGSTFKKCYQDPILGRPVARFVTPKNFITSYNTTDLSTSPRFTHVTQMTKKQLKLAMLSGAYRKIDLGDPQQNLSTESPIQAEVDKVQGIEPGAEGTDEYNIYEIYADIDLKGFENEDGIPLPYIVTVDEQSKKVLSIRRN